MTPPLVLLGNSSSSLTSGKGEKAQKDGPAREPEENSSWWGGRDQGFHA